MTSGQRLPGLQLTTVRARQAIIISRYDVVAGDEVEISGHRLRVFEVVNDSTYGTSVLLHAWMPNTSHPQGGWWAPAILFGFPNHMATVTFELIGDDPRVYDHWWHDWKREEATP